MHQLKISQSFVVKLFSIVSCDIITCTTAATSPGPVYFPTHLPITRSTPTYSPHATRPPIHPPTDLSTTHNPRTNPPTKHRSSELSTLTLHTHVHIYIVLFSCAKTSSLHAEGLRMPAVDDVAAGAAAGRSRRRSLAVALCRFVPSLTPSSMIRSLGRLLAPPARSPARSPGRPRLRSTSSLRC